LATLLKIIPRLSPIIIHQNFYPLLPFFLSL
jgi:hypothetical protein